MKKWYRKKILGSELTQYQKRAHLTSKGRFLRFLHCLKHIRFPTLIKNFHLNLHGQHWIEKNYPNTGTPNFEEFLFLGTGDKFFIFPVVMTIQK